MKKVEILAPVGGDEQLRAAVANQADAVYFGASSFNARRNAENFDDEAFISAVRYCRERAVKVYVTLNTIFKDSEAEEFEKTLELIVKSGADAVILQDMGAVGMIKKCCPTLTMHASTQMAVHNVSGAKFLESMGFSRIVLARELSIKEIEKICSAVNIETEVFVHGAHCMSVSGMCYMSSMLGGRSGNRGLCAQPCRLNFKTDKREYALSLKDMCLVKHVSELANAGVTSFKIEGRMKRPEYVASAVKAYKQAINGITPDVSLLQSVFSRSGFTDGFAVGKRDASMFGYRTKEDVVAAAPVLAKIAAECKKEPRTVKVSMALTVKENERIRLILSDGKNSCEVLGNYPEAARNMPLTDEKAKQSLSKLGSTFYYCEDFSCDIGENLMVSASELNFVRREACQRLTEMRGKANPVAFVKMKREVISENKEHVPEIRLMFANAKMIPENIKADKIIIPLRDVLENLSLIQKYGTSLAVSLPPLVYPQGEGKTESDLRKAKENGVKDVYCDNIGSVALALKLGMNVLGGARLNVLNSDAAEMYQSLGVGDITLSSEISFDGVKSIFSSCKTGIIIYGLLPLMHFRCCPLKGDTGCGECKGRGKITDRYNIDFPVYCENRQYSVLYNSVPLYVGDKKIPPVDFVTLCFTDEEPSEIKSIYEAVKNKKPLPGKKTAGLYERELL